jgi:hypothetical protein
MSLRGVRKNELAALRAEKLALFMLVGDGGCLYCSSEHIARWALTLFRQAAAPYPAVFLRTRLQLHPAESPCPIDLSIPDHITEK